MMKHHIKIILAISLLGCLAWLIYPDVRICHVKQGKTEISCVSISFLGNGWCDFFDYNVDFWDVILKRPNVKAKYHGGFGACILFKIVLKNGIATIYPTEGAFYKQRENPSNQLILSRKHYHNLKTSNDLCEVCNTDSCIVKAIFMGDILGDFYSYDHGLISDLKVSYDNYE